MTEEAKPKDIKVKIHDRGGRKTKPENRRAPVTGRAKATAATEFVSSIFCQRFLRNVNATLTVQLLAISSIIFLILFQPEVALLTSSNAQNLVIVNSTSYVVIVITLTLFNKFYRKAGDLNYIPLLVVTSNLGSLLAIPVLIYGIYEILGVVLTITVHWVVMTGCQVLGHWEPSLPSGIFGIILGNTVIGTILLIVSIHGYHQPPYPSYMLFVLQIITTTISGYILYDLELMTSEPGLHKLYHYKVVYGNHAHAALHVSTDLVRGILTIPKYFYHCCGFKFHRVWYVGFIPRSGYGMRCGKIDRREHSDSDD